MIRRRAFAALGAALALCALAGPVAARRQIRVPSSSRKAAAHPCASATHTSESAGRGTATMPAPSGYRHSGGDELLLLNRQIQRSGLGAAVPDPALP
mgnify:CR=1 FL=1